MPKTKPATTAAKQARRSMPMTKSRKPWTAGEIKRMRGLVGRDTPTKDIAKELERTVPAIRAKAFSEGISLR